MSSQSQRGPDSSKQEGLRQITIQGGSYLPPFTSRKQLLRTHPPPPPGHLLSPQWLELSQIPAVLGAEAVSNITLALWTARTETEGGEKQAEVMCMDQSHWVTESTEMGEKRRPPQKKTHI